MKVVLPDIVRQVSKATHLTLPDAKVVVQRLVSTLEKGLLEGQKIEIRDFGVFQVKTVSGKVGRDLNRGVFVPIPPFKKVSFKAGKNLKNAFRREQGEKIGGDAFPTDSGSTGPDGRPSVPGQASGEGSQLVIAGLMEDTKA